MSSKDYIPDEPIAAIATALAPSALAIIRLSGKDTISLLAKIFSRPKTLLQANGNTLVYGWIIEPDTKTKIDEVMISVYRTPKSYTGEEMAEISCHGGVSSVTAIFNLLLKNGFKNAQRGEFTFRAYVNGKIDLTKSEAIKEIIDSKTDTSRSLAAGRLSGNLFQVIQEIKQLIISTIAMIEVEIEYPEDEENFSDSFDQAKLKQAKYELELLSNSWKSQKLYQDGARVILCGKTNAGKSSLFNALLKEERAIVSDIEGTTRDWIESWVSFDGIPARLFDTAGLRNTTDVVEQKGVQMTKDLSKEADVVIYLIDGTKSECNEDKNFIDTLNNKIPVVKVINKVDIANVQKNDKSIYYISAKTGQGVSELIKGINQTLLTTNSSEREQAGLGSQRQKDAIDEALLSVNHAIDVVNSDYTLDVVVQDLEDSLESLSEITGEVTPDDILSNIFENFCVGK